MQRDKKIDGLKFILIFLVVLGHMTYNDFGLGLTRMIYSFHMPVFVFLSGYFTSLNSNKDKHRHWLKQTALLFMFAQLVHIMIQIAYRYASPAVSTKGLILLSDFYKPRFALWYLLCLIYWRLLAWNCFRKKYDIWFLSGSLVLSVLVGFVPIGSTFSFQRAFAFLPFFLLGIMFRYRDWFSKLEKIPVPLCMTLMIVCLLVSRCFLSYEPKHFYENWNDVLLRILQTGIGLLMCILVIRMSRSVGWIERFAQWGVYTLWIYVGHTFFVAIERHLLPHFGITYNIFIAIILSILYCALFILLAKLHDRITRKDVS